MALWATLPSERTDGTTPAVPMNRRIKRFAWTSMQSALFRAPCTVYDDDSRSNIPVVENLSPCGHRHTQGNKARKPCYDIPHAVPMTILYIAHSGLCDAFGVSLCSPPLSGACWASREEFHLPRAVHQIIKPPPPFY